MIDPPGKNTSWTLPAWWPNDPASSNWNTSVKYEIIDDGGIITTASPISQRSGGDEWNLIASNISLSPSENPYLRITCSGGAKCVADAIRIRSTGSKYNDGSALSQITLLPEDGILLKSTPIVYDNFLYIPVITK